MRYNYSSTILIMAGLLFCSYGFSQSTPQGPKLELEKETSLLLRPNANIGYLGKELIYSVGFRTLLPAGENKFYGIEVSRYSELQKQRAFITAGIVLEQKLFNWFNMSIGTIGYFNFGEEARNVVGISSNLGWEPNSRRRISPYVTYRSDYVFAAKVQTMNSLNVGLNIKFFTPRKDKR